MDYIDSIVDYKQILTLLIVRKPLQIDLDFSTESSNSPLVLHLLCIIETLYLNLKAKSKHYKDAALSNFFVMNNVHYIVHRIKGSFELREMIGEEFTNRLANEYNLTASFYLNSWKGVFDCLEIDCFERLGGLFAGSFFSRLRFKAFQARFKEVVEAQSGWILAEAELRKEFRILVLLMIMPLYTAFLHRHGKNVGRLKQFGNFCDVEKVVMCLFEG
ncbi:hypothetical protein SASPL_115255 [Salvia splendens]|uniref:Exocyst subunit Exo70 family protein n=2 Tax=Salvia splendens TaxID=180675 RepID=A0A8X8Y762_SALSN|nr:hypothetical protein SASPL_115255 [Salvia splendens]